LAIFQEKKMASSRPAITSVTFWNSLFAFVLTGAAFSVYFQQSPGGCGDYPQNFEVLFYGMGIGTVFALLFHILYPLIPNAFVAQPVLLVVIRFYLASIILGYGFAKVFASQFPHLMANLDARFIELTPMRVAWAFFGYSKGYQIFLGWGEVIPAVLLLFRRTTLLGSILMFTVMLNVFLVNIFFDVCVKLNSGLYTALALYILLQETGRLWNFFFTGRIIGPRVDIILTSPRWLKITGQVLKYGALAYILWTNGSGAWATYQYANTHVTLTPVQGAWKAVAVWDLKSDTSQVKNTADTLYANRLFFDGYNGVIRSDFIRDRFRFSIDSTKSLLTVNFTNLRNEWNIAPVQWKYMRQHEDSLTITGRWKTDSLQILCVRRKEKLTRY
jgi:hypothetical protein